MIDVAVFTQTLSWVGGGGGEGEGGKYRWVCHSELIRTVNFNFFK